MTEAEFSPETKGRDANHEPQTSKALVFLEHCVSRCTLIFNHLVNLRLNYPYTNRIKPNQKEFACKVRKCHLSLKLNSFKSLCYEIKTVEYEVRRIGNTDAQWEEQSMINVGVDVTLLNHLRLTAEYTQNRYKVNVFCCGQLGNDRLCFAEQNGRLLDFDALLY